MGEDLRALLAAETEYASTPEGFTAAVCKTVAGEPGPGGLPGEYWQRIADNGDAMRERNTLIAGTPPPKPVDVPITHGRTARVQPGVINAASIEAYTNGQCYSLAQTLAQRTGWDVVLLVEDSEDGQVEYPWEAADVVTANPEWTLDVIHALVRRPDGKYVDINGARTEDHFWSDLDQDGQGYYLMPASPTHLTTLMAQADAPVQNMKLAGLFATAVLRQG